jgi:hypothetical protein
MTTLKSVKLTTKQGTTWTTSVNGQLDNETIAKYFMGNSFNVGIYPVEKIETVSKIEFLD